MALSSIHSLTHQLPLAVSRGVQSRFSVLSLRPLSALAANGLGLRPFSAYPVPVLSGSPLIRTISTLGRRHAYQGQLTSTRQFSRTFSSNPSSAEGSNRSKLFDYITAAIRDNKGKLSVLAAVGGSVGTFFGAKFFLDGSTNKTENKPKIKEENRKGDTVLGNKYVTETSKSEKEPDSSKKKDPLKK